MEKNRLAIGLGKSPIVKVPMGKTAWTAETRGGRFLGLLDTLLRRLDGDGAIRVNFDEKPRLRLFRWG